MDTTKVFDWLLDLRPHGLPPITLPRLITAPTALDEVVVKV
jgi:hypothetical protein